MAALLMPRERRSQGRPGTAVIPARWAESHRPVADKTMTATAAVRKPGTVQAWSDVEQQNVTVPKVPYYTGPCRVQALATQAREVVVAADDETVASYLITLTAATELAESDLVRVTDSGDPLLDGHSLRILQVVTGSLRFERDLFCTLTD